MKHTEENVCKFVKKDFPLDGKKVKKSYCSVHEVFVCDGCDMSFSDHYSGGMWICYRETMKKRNSN